jgi:hemerythrin-like domain-containing protein
MLTATYTLVALSVEQASVRLSLLSFQKYVRSTLLQQNSITLAQLEYACATLNSLYQACYWRKTEMYLIPALRQTTERADQLLDELNRLNQSALTAIRSVQERVGIFADVQDFRVEQVCDSIEMFCASMLQRLEKEEQELFAIARTAFAGDTWFSIANQLMMHDKHLEEMKRSAPPVAHAESAATPGPVTLLPVAHSAARAEVRPNAQIAIPGGAALPVIDAGSDPAPTGAASAPELRVARAQPPVRHAQHAEAMAK